MGTENRKQAEILPAVQELPMEQSPKSSKWQEESSARLKQIWDRKYEPMRRAIEESLDEC